MKPTGTYRVAVIAALGVCLGAEIACGAGDDGELGDVNKRGCEYAGCERERLRTGEAFLRTINNNSSTTCMTPQRFIKRHQC